VFYGEVYNEAIRRTETRSGPSLGVDKSLPGAPDRSRDCRSGPSLGVDLSLPGAPDHSRDRSSGPSLGVNTYLGSFGSRGYTAYGSAVGGVRRAGFVRSQK
jgi:hypothetical protein